MTFLEAQKMYETTRKRKLARNCYLVKTDRGYGVKLYRTVIVEYLDQNRTEINTGGWDTMTTWKRIAEFSGFRYWFHGFKRREDVPDHVVLDSRDDFLEYPAGYQTPHQRRRAYLLKRIAEDTDFAANLRRSEFKLIQGGAK